MSRLGSADEDRNIDDDMSGNSNSNNIVTGSGAASGASAANGGAHKSHNRVWINPNFVPKPAGRESALTDKELLAKMGMGPAGDSNTPPRNEYGKRPRKQGPTPTQKPEGKKGKKGKGKGKTVTSAQQRLTAARGAAQGQEGNKGSGDAGQQDGSSSSAQMPSGSQDVDESRNRKKAKSPSLAKLMGGSKEVVAQLEQEQAETQPLWLAEQAAKRKERLFPSKPEGVAQELLNLADTFPIDSDMSRVCRVAALAIEKAVTVLHKQADGRTEAVLDEVLALQRRFEESAADAARQTRKLCIEFQAYKLAPEAGEYISNSDFLRRLNLILHLKHGITIPSQEVSDVHPLWKKRAGTVIVKFADRKEGSAYHFLSSPWLLPKNDPKIQLEMSVAVSPYDGNIREALLWWKKRCEFMRATAVLKGIPADVVVPPHKWILGVKVAATP